MSVVAFAGAAGPMITYAGQFAAAAAPHVKKYVIQKAGYHAGVYAKRKTDEASAQLTQWYNKKRGLNPPKTKTDKLMPPDQRKGIKAKVPYSPPSSLKRMPKSQTVRRKKKNVKKMSKRIVKSKGRRRGRKAGHKAYVTTITNEWGGVQNDPQACYTGHGIGSNQFLQSLCRALVYQLYKKGGYDIADFDDTPPCGVTTTMFIIIRYRLRATQTALVESTVTVAANGSYKNNAEGLAVNLVTLGPTNELFDIRLSMLNTDEDKTLSVMLFKEITLNFKWVSELKIQNTTLAATTVVGNEGEVTNVSSNPLTGKLYTKKGCGFDPRSRGTNVAIANYKSFIPHKDSGIISANSSLSANNSSRKPPAGSFFAAKAVKRMMSPGQIIIDKQSWTVKGNMDNLAQRYGSSYTDNVASKNNLGTSRMYGLEKLLDTRTSEPNINISFELVQNYHCGVSYRKKRVTIPTLFISGTAETNPPLV